MNVIEYFDRARIINMASRKDRRLETEEEFARNGFGIDGEKTGFFKAITVSEGKGFPSIGVRGCFLSHLGVLEEAMRLNAKNVLVMEDDIQFSRAIAEHGRKAVESLQGMEWDVLYFGHPFDVDSNSPGWKQVDRPIHLTHFYAINARCFETLREFLVQVKERPPGHPDGGSMHFDAALNTLIHKNKDIAAYYFTWNLGYQRPSRTDLHDLSILDRLMFLRPLMDMLRRVKAKRLRVTR